MSAKQSEILVARAKKRRTLRDELRARCAVFNENDDERGMSETAPEGWVEIQRNDSVDEEGLEPFASDEHAALAVAELGTARGSAMFYELDSGLFEPIALDGLGTHALRWGALNQAATLITLGDAKPHWICIVPRGVAIRAGLDCEWPS